jgi:hypothetical protein
MPEANNEPLITDDDLNLAENIGGEPIATTSVEPDTTPEPENLSEPTQNTTPEFAGEIISIDGEPIPQPPLAINDTPTGELAKRFNELQNKYELKLQQVQDLEEFLVNTQFQLTNKDTELKSLRFQYDELNNRFMYFTDTLGFVTGQTMEFFSKILPGIPYDFMLSLMRQALLHPKNTAEAVQHNINANIQNVEILKAIGEGRVTINPAE